MNYHDAEFITSSSGIESWPNHNFNEIVLTGRSNVGKSSLINTLCNRKKLAYTGNTPGKTRLLNFFLVDNSLVFVDAPGYGFAKRSIKEQDHYSKMMSDYFEKRNNLKLLVILVDMRHKPTRDDIDMIEFARYYHINTLVVATKADKVKASERVKQKKLICSTLDIPSFIEFSSITRKGYEEVWQKLDELKKPLQE